MQGAFRNQTQKTKAREERKALHKLYIYLMNFCLRYGSNYIYRGIIVHNAIKKMKIQERQEQRWGKKKKQTKQTLYAKRVPTQEKKFF
jgi:hypothetical protein